MCTVLFLDIVEYSKKLVSEQLRIREQFNTRIAAAIQDIAVNDRIILDTGDGVAINFLGDPEDALFVGMNLSQAFASADEPRVEVRIGINLGPVRLVRDVNGQPNIIGDGINVAERVMSFARPGQVLVSRTYYEVVTRISDDYAQLFAYQGSRTDKHVREHEIYEVATAGGEAHDLATRRHHARPAGRPALVDLHESTQTQTLRAAPPPGWLSNRKLAFGAATASAIALVAGILFQVLEPKSEPAPSKPAKAVTMVAPKPVEAPPPVVVATPEPPAPSVAEPEPPAPPAKPVKNPAKTVVKPHKPATMAKVDKVAPHSSDSQGAKPAPEASLPWKAPAVEAPPPPPPVTAKAPAGPTAFLTLAISPWGEVLVDGKSMGVSPPLSELQLAPGTYRIEIRNGSFRPYREMLELEANQTIRIKHKFKQP
jgi:class 3 adenylate cyclase